jgi:predicted enzyme involved in methoxymalonyl-ACP biosynthesis
MPGEGVDWSGLAALRESVKKAVADSSRSLEVSKKVLVGLKRHASSLESQGGAAGMSARVCLPRYTTLAQEYMNVLKENQRAKLSFRSASTDRLASQAHLMKEFDGVSEDDLRRQLEENPALIAQTVQRMASGEVQAAYRIAREKEAVSVLLVWCGSCVIMVRRRRWPSSCGRWRRWRKCPRRSQSSWISSRNR